MIHYKDIKAAKQECALLAFELHDRFSANTTYREQSPDGSSRRPVIILKNQAELDEVIEVTDKIAALRNQILEASGRLPRFTEPRIIENVLLYKIWANTERSSASSVTTRAHIISNIKYRLAIVRRYSDNTSKMNAVLLENELAFFERETEEKYRARTLGMPSSLCECHVANNGVERIKISEAGLFIVGPNFDIPKGDLPSKKPRKPRPTIYDMVESIPYSGAERSMLYRESEVIAAKQKAGFDAEAQKAVVDGNKNISRKRLNAPPEHPMSSSDL